MDPEYSFPFDPELYGISISQGFHGPWSHGMFEIGTRILDLSYSVDFVLPIGTPIRAAHEGVVYCIQDTVGAFYEGIDPEIGFLSFPNFVVIEGYDGTHTLYSHLEKGSALVSKGSYVSDGQPVARSGRSGWIGPTPHLHFERLESVEKKIHRTLPFVFTDYSESLEHNELGDRLYETE